MGEPGGGSRADRRLPAGRDLRPVRDARRLAALSFDAVERLSACRAKGQRPRRALSSSRVDATHPPLSATCLQPPPWVLPMSPIGHVQSLPDRTRPITPPGEGESRQSSRQAPAAAVGGRRGMRSRAAALRRRGLSSDCLPMVADERSRGTSLVRGTDRGADATRPAKPPAEARRSSTGVDSSLCPGPAWGLPSPHARGAIRGVCAGAQSGQTYRLLRPAGLTS